MLGIEKKHILMLACNACVMTFFAFRFVLDWNYEFLIYLWAVSIFAGIIIYSNRYMKYSQNLLYLLSFGILIHLAWGWISIDGWVLYDQMIFRISETYDLIRYDQFAHMYWFFTATILSYEVLKKQLLPHKITFSIAAILIMAGCGFGAINEVIEFLVDQILPKSWVGWYINTWVDLVVNLIGSILWVVFIKIFLENKSQ